MEYRCPKCGWRMVCISTASIPPITRYECLSCGYRSKETKDLSYIVLPILPKELQLDDEDKEDEV